MTRESRLSPVDDVADPGFIRRLFDTIESLYRGQSRNRGTVTLTANVTTTTVSHSDFESSQTPVLVPLTANAAAALATTYVSARTTGSFTLTHANNAQTDKTFDFVFVG